MSFGNGTEGRSGGRFGAATPGLRTERAAISDLVAMRAPGRTARRRRVITPWRTTALIAAIIVAGGSYALGRYVIAPKPPPEVRLVITAKPLPKGERLTRADYQVITVRRSDVPRSFLNPKAAHDKINWFAKDTIPAGTFLAAGMLAASGKMPDATHALVGLTLKPGQMPVGGLVVGQHVGIVLLPVNALSRPSEPIRVSDAKIWALLPPDSSGAEEVTVLVPRGEAANLANYAAHGQVGLIATEAPGQG